MKELIEAIKAWPVIVQGALGSALFWLVLVIGQWAAVRISRGYSHRSKWARFGWLTNRRVKLLRHLSQSDAEFSTYAVILLYRASRPLFRALMWLALGLVFETLFAPAGIVGFFGCLYYLLKAADIVGRSLDITDAEAEMRDVDAELWTLRKALGLVSY